MSELYRTRGSEALQRREELSRSLEEKLRSPYDRKKRETKKRTNIQPSHEKFADSAYAPRLGAIGFLGLAVSFVVLIYVSILYLSVNDRIVKVNKEAKMISVKTDKLRVENDDKENKLYSQIDLEMIREKAIRDLGMVYPYKNQVIKYQAVSGGYVRQFGEMGGSKERNFLERILSIFVAR